MRLSYSPISLSCLRRSLRRLKSTTVDYKGHGLLTGINDIENSLYYTNSLQIDSASTLVNNTNYIYKTALSCFNGDVTKTKEHINKVSVNAQKFVSSDELFDREELFSELNEIVSTKGTFACIVGGKSTGKSFLMKQLMDNVNRTIVRVDLRSDDDLLRALVKALEEKSGKDFIEFFYKAFPLISGFMPIQGLDRFIDILKPEDHEKCLITLLQKLHDMYPSKALTIIVDEANIAFEIKDDEKNKIDNVKKILAQFVRLTKQNRMINVILASSEHAFPYRLSHPSLGFKILDVGSLIYAGDVPPKDMMKLLTEKLGAEEKFASALIDVYGGNIFFLVQALQLAKTREKSDREPQFYLNAEFSDSVASCLASDGYTLGMIKTLRQLAETGFVPIVYREDRLAKAISLHNIGGVIRANATATGVPPELWHGRGYGIVPAGQSMRLAIANVLSIHGEGQLVSGLGSDNY